MPDVHLWIHLCIGLVECRWCESRVIITTLRELKKQHLGAREGVAEVDFDFFLPRAHPKL